ncbi:type VII secretion protein EsaA [Streptococcus iniae]|uniref:Type VII secretion system accessory factor EsaA n=2 Tax=Streptococcus iniae TaxID=1346 RepID=A0ABM5QJL8_STRIN|nr:type VII secretion protein EsaA [Streptococcus iniae]AGM99608.1 phage infection protein [Streptococcus iniae SF1]AHY16524.1 phage infection protein [Streptococcus iniae]AHY18388.1 phage infection protein [Streptococcus iniae]APD32547.1 type VII secretion protein EsaA [Streptococcus iniae]AYB01648.1 type VII secretion protein EsaA [Streptococcus iniae]
MKVRKNVRIVWYIVAVILLLGAIVGLNLAIQANNEKGSLAADAHRQTKLDIALVNEDQSIVSGPNVYNLGTSYVKSIERDDSQNWSVVSRGTAENGLKKGDYQLMLIIPSDFSKKVLDIDNSSADRSIVTYKINTAGNLELEKEATKKGKDIVADLNSQLVDMYMASILSNLYTAQQNVQSMMDVQTGNVSTYQKNLYHSATDFQNIFPALLAQSGSSVTANDALKKSLDSYSSMYDGLTEAQTGFTTSLSKLLEKRAQDKISYEDFTQNLIQMGDLQKQIQPIVQEMQVNQSELMEMMSKVYKEADADGNEGESTLKSARQTLEELHKTLLKHQSDINENNEKLETFVKEALATYFDQRHIDDDLTLADFLKKEGNSSQSANAFEKATDNMVTKSLTVLPDSNPANLYGMPSEELSNITFDSGLADATGLITGRRNSLARELKENFDAREAAKAAVANINLPSNNQGAGTQTFAISSESPQVQITSWTVNGESNPSTISSNQENQITVNYNYVADSSNASTTTSASKFTVTIGQMVSTVSSDDSQKQEAYRNAEAAYQRSLQKVIDAYNTAGSLMSQYYHIGQDGKLNSLTSDFLNQSVKELLTNLLTQSIKGYLTNPDSVQSEGRIKALLSELENNQEILVEQLASVSTNSRIVSQKITDSLAELDNLLKTSKTVEAKNTEVGNADEATTTSIQTLSSQLEALKETTTGAKELAKSNSEEASQVNTIFSSFNKDVESAQDTGKKLSADAGDLMVAFEKELANNGNFVDSFSKVFNSAYQNGVPNNVLLDFLAQPVTENASSVKATVNVYRPFTWILLLEVVSLFTAYIFATQNLLKKLTNRYTVNKFLETDFLNVGIISALALISGLVLGTVSSNSLNVTRELVPSWTLLIVLFSFLLVHSQYFLLKNLKAIGMGLSLFMIISFVYLSNAIGTVATVKGFPKILKNSNPLSVLEGKLSAYFDSTSVGFTFLAGIAVLIIALIVANIFITLRLETKAKEH